MLAPHSLDIQTMAPPRFISKTPQARQQEKSINSSLKMLPLALLALALITPSSSFPLSSLCHKNLQNHYRNNHCINHATQHRGSKYEQQPRHRFPRQHKIHDDTQELTKLLLSLGNNYLDDMSDPNGGQPGQRWGIGGSNPNRGTGNLSSLAGGGSKTNSNSNAVSENGGSSNGRGNYGNGNLNGGNPNSPLNVNRGGPGTTGSVRGNNASSSGNGGTGTAIRPPSSADDVHGNKTNSPQQQRSYGLGGGRPKPWGPGHREIEVVGEGMPNKVFGIRQPQDLLDFVIKDERLSVVKVFASWCKTCQIFDIRYRKLASQLSDQYTLVSDPNTNSNNSNNPQSYQLTRRGPVRFAEMQFDDPNNEEMCRLLNATKLPYVLMYKGSKGKVADFQCGPSNFQRLVDEVNELMDPMDEEYGVDGGFASSSLEEIEWSVGLDAEELEQLSQSSSMMSSPSSSASQQQSKQEGMLKRKDEEIARLYLELSTLRNEYEEKMATITEVHKNETNQFQQQLDEQTKEYEMKIANLVERIKDLEEDMATRELEVRNAGEEANRKLKLDMEAKEKYFEKETARLSMRIAGLEEALLQSKKELKATSEISNQEKEELLGIIAGLEEEQERLNNRIEELEAELVEEKRAVVTTAEQASRVLKELEELRAGKYGERNELVARIQVLEAEMVERENQSKEKEKVAMGLRREVEKLKREHEKEREIMANRIVELEREISFKDDQGAMEESAYELRQQSGRLADRIAELEKDIEERDRLLQTSNKATDLLLSKMEKQKRKYEEELDRTNALANELEDAIASREEEMSLLQQKFSKLERMTSGLKSQDRSRELTSRSYDLDNSSGEGQRQHLGENSWRGSDRAARIKAERELSKLTEMMKEKEKEVNRLKNTGSERTSYQNPLFGGLFGSTVEPKGNTEADKKKRVDYSERWGYPDETTGEAVLGDSDEDFWKMDFEGVVSPPRSNNDSVGAPRSYDEALGSQAHDRPSSSYGGQSLYGGIDGTQQFYKGTIGEAPSPSAAAFEQRIAANPILPPGAFGSSRASSPVTSPRIDSRDSVNGGRSGGGQRDDIWQGVPATPSSPEMAAFEQRIAESPIVPPGAFGASSPTRRSAPSPRTGSGAGRTDSIYAGAGAASGGGGGGGASKGRAPNGAGAGDGRGISRFVSAPAPSPAVPQMPTPAMAFEQRLAANPIVPAGAFGGSQPTAHFFNKSTQNGSQSSEYGSSAPTAPPGPDVGRGRRPENDSQSKWAALDEAEKKKVAAEAYKAFEKNLADRRNPPSPAGRTTRGPAASNPPQNLSQLERERQKHQDMVANAYREKSDNAQKKQEPTMKGNMKDEEIERLRKEQEAEQARMKRLRAEEAARDAAAKKETAAARMEREKQQRTKADLAAKLEKERKIQAEKVAQKKQDDEAARRKQDDEDRLQREKEARAKAEQAARVEKEKMARAKKEAERRAQAMEEEARLQRAKEERAKAEARLQLAKEERAQRQLEAKRKKENAEKPKSSQQSAPDIKFPKNSESQRPTTRSKGSAVAAISPSRGGDRAQGSWINRVLKEGKSGGK